MKEIELKFHVDDFARIESKFQFGDSHQEVDCYYQHPFRDFVKTNEWLRLRTITYPNGSQEPVRVTYKGPKNDISRTEIEIILEPAIQTGDNTPSMLLDALGFTPLVTVTKNRRIAVYDRESIPRYITICLDEVSGLGKFVELEALGTEKDIKTISSALYLFATELELNLEEKHGYAQMMLAHA